MAPTRVLLALALIGTATFPGCGRLGPKGPSREEVTGQLRQEADALKRDGEKMDPILRVTATWNIASLDVTERPGDADRPWAGSILFKIRSDTKDFDGSVKTDEFQKRFDYLYSAALKRWIFDYKPTPGS
jgi:hypothetical protein